MGSHMVAIIKRDIIINPLTILNYIFYITVQIFVNWRFLSRQSDLYENSHDFLCIFEQMG
jgi:hypothetical protein